MCVNTAQIGNEWGLLTEQYAELREGTSAVLLQSGLDEKWWADSMELLLSAKHSRSLVWWEDTIWKEVRDTISRTSDPVRSSGRISPFFCWRPIETTLIWCKSLAWYIPWTCEEVLTPLRGEHFIFPVADGTVKISGEDQDLRTSTLIRDSPDRGEEQDNLRGESDGSFWTPTTRPVRSQKWFWVNLRRFYLPSSRGTPSQTVRADWRIIPDSLWTDKTLDGQGGGAPKACPKQADSRGSRTCVCANTLCREWHTEGEKGELTSCRATV